MIFEYQEVVTKTAQIDVDDIGNCCLLCRNLLGEEWYLYINTQVGCTQVITYGPIVPDIDQLPMSVRYDYSRFDFNENKIIKIINKFIADAEYVELSDIDYVRLYMKPMIDNMIDYGVEDASS